MTSLRNYAVTYEGRPGESTSLCLVLCIFGALATSSPAQSPAENHCFKAVPQYLLAAWHQRPLLVCRLRYYWKPKIPLRQLCTSVSAAVAVSLTMKYVDLRIRSRSWSQAPYGLLFQTHWIGWVFRVTGILCCTPLMLLSTRQPRALHSMDACAGGAALLALWCSAARELLNRACLMKRKHGPGYLLSYFCCWVLGCHCGPLTALREICLGILMLRRHAGL